jgi:hypothetical protein
VLAHDPPRAPELRQRFAFVEVFPVDPRPH